MDNDWVSVHEDVPCLGKNRKRVSVDINVILIDDTVIENCFCTVDDGKYYDENGKHIPKNKLKGWQTR